MKNLNYLFSQIFSEKFDIINVHQIPSLTKSFVGVVFKMSSAVNRLLINKSLSVLKFLSFQKPKITKLKYFYVSKQKNFIFTAHCTLRNANLFNFYYISYNFYLNNKFFPSTSRYVLPILNLSNDGSFFFSFSNFYSFLKFKNFFYNWVYPVNILFLLKNSNLSITKWFLSFYNLSSLIKKCP
jgi:hypothetical protein